MHLPIPTSQSIVIELGGELEILLNNRKNIKVTIKQVGLGPHEASKGD